MVHRLAMPLAAAAVAALLYVPTLTHGLVLDSVEMTRYNEFLRDPETGALDLWRHGYWHGISGVAPRGSYRPLTVTTLWLLPRIGLGSPLFQHGFNVALHACATLCLAALLMEIGLARSVVAVVAIWFAVHPVHTEPVCYVVGRAEILMTLFALLSLLSHVVAARAVSRPRRSALLAVAFGLAFLSMASKENGVAVVGLVPIAEGWMVAVGRPPLWRGRGRWVVWALWLIPLGVFLAVRHAALGIFLAPREGMIISALDGLASWPRSLLALSVLGEVWRVCLPVAQLSADYGFPRIEVPTTILDRDVLGGLMGLGFVIGLPVLTLLQGLVRRDERGPAVALLGAAWFSIAWLPTSHFIFVAGEPFAERWLYLPSVGLLVWVAALLHAVVGEGRVWRWTVTAVAVVMTLASAARIPDWRDFYAITRASAETSPHTPRVLYNVATKALMARDYAEALVWFDNYFTWADPSDQHWNAALNNLAVAQRAERIHRQTGRHPELPPEVHFTRFQPVAVPPRDQSTEPTESPDNP